MVFKMDLRIPKDRADGRRGFVYVKMGETPEEHGFTAEQVEELAPLLMDASDTSERVTATVTMTEAELLKRAPIMDRIKLAIAGMLKDDPNQKDEKLWTKEKLPRVDSIEMIIDERIKEDQRDEAWDNFQKEGDKQ